MADWAKWQGETTHEMGLGWICVRVALGSWGAKRGELNEGRGMRVSDFTSQCAVTSYDFANVAVQNNLCFLCAPMRHMNAGLIICILTMTCGCRTIAAATRW